MLFLHRFTESEPKIECTVVLEHEFLTAASGGLRCTCFLVRMIQKRPREYSDFLYNSRIQKINSLSHDSRNRGHSSGFLHTDVFFLTLSTRPSCSTVPTRFLKFFRTTNFMLTHELHTLSNASATQFLSFDTIRRRLLLPLYFPRNVLCVSYLGAESRLDSLRRARLLH